MSDMFLMSEKQMSHLAVLAFGAWRLARQRQASYERYSLCDPMRSAIEIRCVLVPDAVAGVVDNQTLYCIIRIEAANIKANSFRG